MKKHLLLIVFLCLVISSYSQVNLNYKGSLKGLFSLLQNQYGYKFIYSNDEVNDQQPISIVVTNSSIENVLKEIYKQTHISYRIINKQIIVKYDKKKPEEQPDLKKNTPETPVQKPDTKIIPQQLIIPPIQTQEDSTSYTITEALNPKVPIDTISLQKPVVFETHQSDSIPIPNQKQIQDTSKVLLLEGSIPSPNKVTSDTETPMPIADIKQTEATKTSTPKDTNLLAVYKDSQHDVESLIPTIDSASQTEGTKAMTNSNSTFEFSLQNNLLYDAILTPNLGLECKINQKWGIMINGLWTHINWDNGNKTYRIWAVSPEVRYYLFDSKRFYTGGMFHIGQLNLKLGETGYQGDFIGGGITAGYLIHLNKHFQLDLGIGLGYTYFNYESYKFIDGINTKQDSGNKNFWGPTKAGITLIFKL